jgi:predicted ABC-type ATPase
MEAFGRSVWIINPDELSARISGIEGLSADEANLSAVKRIEAWLRASIAAHQTVGVETVLSTAKYRPLVVEAKRLGFEIRLIYVVLDTPRRNIERVRLRVKKGGHNVPREKIVARYFRSLEQLPWFLEQADTAWIFDNSGATPKKVAEKSGGTVELQEDALPSVIEAVNKIKTG